MHFHTIRSGFPCKLQNRPRQINVKNLLPVWFLPSMSYTRFFYKELFIRNLHVEGQKTYGNFTFKGQITKELYNFA